MAHAVDFVTRVCQLAGQPNLIRDFRSGLREQGVVRAIEQHDTAVLFDWLMTTLSYQGIADRVAEGYLREHGNICWGDVEGSLAAGPSCPKLSGYWRFSDCRYQKGAETCSEPDHFPACPVPRHDLRNGHLNQMAYSLFLFLRDVVGGDLIAWIDAQLTETGPGPSAADRLAILREALAAPLRNVYGVSDKVAAMVLSTLLLGGGKANSLWREVGASFVVVDRLVHNFLHRTGILRRFEAEHPYGPACYRPGNCADALRAVADEIDARVFNPQFPAVFPRFVQWAIWQYCAESGLNICNGNRINDRGRCDYVFCRLRSRCDRVILRESEKTAHIQ